MKIKKSMLIQLGLILLVITICAMPVIYAAEFDNVKSYDPVLKEITIKNSFLGIPTTEIAKVRLNSDLVVYAMLGKDRLVAQFTINANDDLYKDALKGIELIDIKTGKPINREIKYKTLSQKVVQKNSYDFICDKDKNNCLTVITGTYSETIDTWTAYNSKDIIKGEVTIGLFTDVYANDYVEWIPTLFGVKINEWAVWTSGLNVGLKSYYKLNGTLTDAVTGAFNWTGFKEDGAGKIGAGVNGVKTLTSYINITGGAYAEFNGTINMWIINNSATSAGIMANQSANAGGDIYTDANGVTWLMDVDNYIITKGWSINNWHMFTFVYNATGLYGYLDGALNTSQAGKYRNMSGNGPWMLGRDLGGGSANTGFDEIGFWNRTLSATEILQLYNNGNGMTYDSNPLENTLNVTLIAPTDASTSTSSNIVFNASFVPVNLNITNATLFVYNTSGTYATNFTTFPATTNDSSNMSLYLSNIPDASYTWNVLACGRNATNSALCSIATSNFSFTQDVLQIRYVNETVPTTLIEGQNTTYYLNITATSITSKAAYLYVNQTLVNGSVAESNSTFARFKFNFFAPLVNQISENVSIHFNYTINGLALRGTSSKNITIGQVIIANCSAAYPTGIVNFTTRYEINGTLINGTNLYSVFNVWSSGENQLINRTFNLTRLLEFDGIFEFCIYPNYANVTGNYYGIYDGEGFRQRGYYISNGVFNNITKFINLYLINSSTSALVSIYVQDQYQKAITNAYIYIQRYDIAIDSYILVNTLRTNSEGYDIAYLEWYNVLYKFVVVIDGVQVLVSTPTKVSADTYTLSIIPSSSFTYDKFNSLTYSLTYSNITKIVTLTYTDVSTQISGGCLRVATLNNNASAITNIVCDNCANSTSATIICDLSAQPDGTYISVFYALGSTKFIDFLYIYLNPALTAMERADGTLFAIIMAGTFALMFAFSPVLGLLMFILGLAGAWILGFRAFELGTFIGIAFVAAIIIWKLKE